MLSALLEIESSTSKKKIYSPIDSLIPLFLAADGPEFFFNDMSLKLVKLDFLMKLLVSSDEQSSINIISIFSFMS